MATLNRATITVDQAAKKLGISRSAAYAAAAAGEIPAIRIGRRILVPLAAINRMLRQVGTARGDAV